MAFDIILLGPPGAGLDQPCLQRDRVQKLGQSRARICGTGPQA